MSDNARAYKRPPTTARALQEDRDGPPCTVRAVVTVEGLRAGRCLAAVERAVLAAPGVLGVDINLVGGTIAIDYDNRVINEERLRTLLHTAD